MQKIKNFRYFQNIIKYVQEFLLKTEDVLIIKDNNSTFIFHFLRKLIYIYILKRKTILITLFLFGFLVEVHITKTTDFQSLLMQQKIFFKGTTNPDFFRSF